MHRARTIVFLGFLLFGAAASAAAAPAVEEAAEAAEAAEVDLDEATAETQAASLDYTFLELIRFGGLVGYVIILLSIAAGALIIDYALLLRRNVLMPEDEIEELGTLVARGKYDEVAADGPRGSFVGALVEAGLADRGRGYEAVEKAMEDRGEELTGRLVRRIEHLNMIANIAPMLGLLGTVIGMVKAFNQISISAGAADPRLLAAGIFQALMTTVMGLIVAIPCMFAYGIFRNRVDALVAEASARGEEVVAPLRPANDNGGAPAARRSRL